MKKTGYWIFLGVICCIISADALARVVTGHVIGSDDPEGLIMATIRVSGTNTGTTTDTEGNFSFNIPDDAQKLSIGYIGYTSQEITIPDDGNFGTITLQASTEILNEVVISGCKDEQRGIKNGTKTTNGPCFPYETDSCIAPRYKLTRKTLTYTDDEEDDIENRYPARYIESSENTVTYYECEDTNGQSCETTASNATAATWDNGVCKVTECAENYAPTKDRSACERIQKCSAAEDAALKQSDSNIAKTKFKDGKCVIASCNKNYIPNDDNTACVQHKGDCTPSAAHATSGNMKNGICYVSACENGWHVSKDKTKCDQAELSEADSQKKIDELQANADKMKEKEQSTANKMLGAAAIGATGIGAMNLLEGKAQQSADADAEQAMNAYLATFTCDYGQGRNIKGGQREIELPGATQLFEQINEYKALAADLKARKEALGLRAGIESEVILDKATTGLYDDVGVGITSGAYTSVARALQDPTGKDAEAWAKQKADAASKVKTGAITAGAGVIGGAIGNLIINRGDDKKNKADEINKKYGTDKLEQTINSMPQQTAPCPNDATGEPLDCTCTDTNKIYNPKTNACESCTGGQIAQAGKCTCPSTQPLWDTTTKQCTARTQVCTPQCNPTEGSHLIIQQDCSCTCADGFDYENGICTCNGENKKIDSTGRCIIERTNTEVIQGTSNISETAVLNAGTLFKIGKSEFANTEAANTALQEFYENLSPYQTCTLIIRGYTDPIGSESSNIQLSIARATAVKDALNAIDSNNQLTIETSGMGESSCYCGVYQGTDEELRAEQPINDYNLCYGANKAKTITGNQRFAPCRRIEISATCSYQSNN